MDHDVGQIDLGIGREHGFVAGRYVDDLELGDVRAQRVTDIQSLPIGRESVRLPLAVLRPPVQ